MNEQNLPENTKKEVKEYICRHSTTHLRNSGSGDSII